MKRHSIIVRLNSADTASCPLLDKASHAAELRFIDGDRRVGHGIGQMLEQLIDRGMYPTENAIDLAILAAAVIAADTRISRTADSQDSWTREIDLYVPVSRPEVWSENTRLVERILRFLTGDIWRVIPRGRQKGLQTLIDRPTNVAVPMYDCVSLFSGGLDSFVGAIDLLNDERAPLFVSHYKDTSTKSQEPCAAHLDRIYGHMSARHVRANVSFDKHDLPNMGTETTTRGRSFIFFALAALAASALPVGTPIYIPENGLISLNVPLDPLRLGAWSTRTTHPFYMARWQELLINLGVDAQLINPYRFNTKGEMLLECKNKPLLMDALSQTVSCSSVGKGRWKRLSPGHCGFCAPCLIRRAAICAAFGGDPTPYSIDDLHAHPLNAKQAESEHVRAFKMMSSRLGEAPTIAPILVHKTGPLSDYPIGDIAQYASVFRRGIAEVGAIVDTVVIEAA